MDSPLAGSKKYSRVVPTASSSGCPGLAPDLDDTPRHVLITADRVLAARDALLSEPGDSAREQLERRL